MLGKRVLVSHMLVQQASKLAPLFVKRFEKFCGSFGFGWEISCTFCHLWMRPQQFRHVPNTVLGLQCTNRNYLSHILQVLTFKYELGAAQTKRQINGELVIHGCAEFKLSQVVDGIRNSFLQIAGSDLGITQCTLQFAKLTSLAETDQLRMSPLLQLIRASHGQHAQCSCEESEGAGNQSLPFLKPARDVTEGRERQPKSHAKYDANCVARSAKRSINVHTACPRLPSISNHAAETHR